MGKPGGFFKKLNAKQKRQASKQRRGTKGASKEVRRQKQNERVEYYAAQREAEQLAQISSSSDDEASTDSEAEEDRRDKKLHRLQRMLGVKTKVRRQEHGREKEDEDEEAQSQDDEVADDASVASSEVPDDESDHPSDGSNDAPEEETDEEDGNEFDGFLMDDEEDDEAVGEASDNPLFDLLDDDNEEGFNDTYRVDESGALVEDDSESGGDEDDEGEEEGEEDEEDDEEEVEGAYEEEEDHTDDAARRSESKVLLPQFKMSSIQLDRLDLMEGGGILERDDPWMQKFHLNTIRAFRSSSTATDALQSVPLSQDAISALTHSNDEQIRRRKELETSVDKKQLGVLFIGSAELAAAHPENLSIRATERAVEAQLHSPFCPTATGSNGSSSATKSAHLHTTSSMEKPPYLHSALWDMWCVYRERMWKEHLPSAEGFAPLTAEERGQLDLLMAYPDLLDSTRCWANAESRCEIYVLHLLNHWFKARSIVVAHDTILAARKRQRRAASKKSHKGKGGKAKRQREEEDEPLEEENDDDGDDHDLELRDRGFSKTRLLVLLPMRNIAYRYVYTMVQILGADPSACPKLNTFEQDFSEVEEAMDPTFKRRPKDYQRQFDGNIDDAFCVGIRLEPSRVHVYSHPLNSDIILCSPLGLRRRLEKNGDIAVSLSSVEVCVVDEAHVLLEQNWQHVTEVMNLVNQRPKDTTHGLSDLRRVYAWALDGKSAEHRQTIVATNISHATILSSFRNWSQNTSGKMLLQHAEEVGSLSRVLVPIRQHFVRFNPPSLDAVDDERLTYFMEQIYATKINPLAERDVRIIILVPSYLDFVRLRNALHRDYRDSFVAISEYTSIKQQRRALGQFSDLEMPVLLLTERCFFFRRYFVKLAEVLVCYSPPLFPDFYCTLINKLVANSPNAMALTLFSRFDTHELNRLVGTARMKLMLERETSAFSFVTS